MLPKHNRIPAYLLKNPSPARFINHPLFSIKLKKNDAGSFRFGFIISKRVDKRAVKRNSIKRRMQAALLSFSFPKQGYDMLFFLKKTAIATEVSEFKKQFQDIFTQERML